MADALEITLRGAGNLTVAERLRVALAVGDGITLDREAALALIRLLEAHDRIVEAQAAYSANRAMIDRRLERHNRAILWLALASAACWATAFAVGLVAP